MRDLSAAGVAIRRFFIVGCQRTGTTLLRLVLECHPAIACLDETNSYRTLANVTATAPRGKSLLGFKIPRWTEQLHDATLGDFGQTETAPQFYEGEPLIFLLRDVRDTVVSMCQLRMGRQTWMDVAGRPILDSKLRQPAFRERFAREIDLLERFGKSDAAVGALYWKYKTVKFFEYSEDQWPVCGVRYEELVSSPADQLRRITEFLAIDWNDALLQHAKLPHTEILPSGLAMGNTDPKRPIDSGSVGQWRTRLATRDIAHILAIAGDINERIASVA